MTCTSVLYSLRDRVLAIDLGQDLVPSATPTTPHPATPAPGLKLTALHLQNGNKDSIMMISPTGLKLHPARIPQRG